MSPPAPSCPCEQQRDELLRRGLERETGRGSQKDVRLEEAWWEGGSSACPREGAGWILR